MVTDNDIGHNGQVNCHIKDDTFKLQSMGSKEYKIVLKKAVDRETQEHYHFTVSCEDKGLPALKTDKDLSIQVLDVNDVEPHFTKDTFKFLTYENDKANFPIGFINATDPDIGKGGELSYSLRNKQQYRLPFQIINSGFISTNQSLDREHRDFYEFEVFVKDNGSPSLNNTVNVEVEVLDRNDNAPYFTFPSVDPFTLNVHYHPQSKNDITVLRASDRDNGNNAFLKYEIVSGNERQLFKLDLFTGVLSYSRTVYQNDVGSYVLEFVVKDSGTPVLSATTSLLLKLTIDKKIYPMSLTLIIIIAVACVVVSLVVIVSLTICIFKHIEVKQSSSARPMPSITEMNDFYNRTDSLSVSQIDNIYRELIPERYKYKRSTSSSFSTVPRPFPMCSEELNAAAYPHYLNQTLGYYHTIESSRKGEAHHYEELPETLDLNICEIPALINADKDEETCERVADQSGRYGMNLFRKDSFFH
ncbi:protocadherin beta-15 [Octopus sinensis]|uniref:Protocadherin beta-15 n=1 Tax=Octopus sinensis TaxID=2607531 RepID=A0A6P7T2C3_9MOLL|nr:protocadherin beta-15 [Octopus sinensis]